MPTVESIFIYLTILVLPPEATAALNQRGSAQENQQAIGVLERLLADAPTHPIMEATLRARTFFVEAELDRVVHLTPALIQRSDETLQMALTHLAQFLGEEQLRFEGLADRISMLPKHLDGIVYWAAINYGRTIPSQPFLRRPWAARRLRRVLQQLTLRSPEFMFQGPRRSLARYLHRAPRFMGGSRAQAMIEAHRALAAAPQYAANYILVYELTMKPELSTEEQHRIVDILYTALRTPETLPNHATPDQLRSKTKARRLLQKLSTP